MRFWLVFLGLTLFAQQQTARIEGRVVDSEGKPVPRATVATGLTTARQPAAAAQTGDDGSFAIDGLEPGSGYLLIVEKPGFLRATYGANRPGSQERPTFALAPGENLRGLTIRMTAQGIIAGHVTDEAGDPAEGAVVTARQPTYVYGEKVLGSAGGTRVDDQGNFRLANLAPGSYTIAVAPRPGELITFFGGTVDPTAARLIEVAPGSESRADMQLLRVPTFAIRGQLVDESDAPLPGRGALARRAVGDPQGRTNVANAEGRFTLAGLLPGEYIVETFATYNSVTGEPMPVPLGSIRVIVGAADVEGVILRTSPGAIVRGTVTVEDAEWKPAPSDTPTRFPALVNGQLLTGGFVPGVTAFAAITLPGAPLGTPRPAQIGADGSFEIAGVGEGEYQLTLGAFPEDYYVKSVHMGETNVTHARLSLPGGALKVVMSTKGASISGAMPRDGIAVVLWPEGGDIGSVYSGIRNTNSGKNGTFRFAGLAPGDYRVAAFDTTETGVLWNYDFVAQFAAQAQLVTVKEAEKATAEPPLIRGDRFQQAFDKLP